MQIIKDVRVVSEQVSTLGESPYWDAKSKCLMYVDMLGKKVLSYTPSTKQTKVWEMPGVIGCVNPYIDNKVIVAIDSGVYYFDLVDECFENIVERDKAWSDSVRYNDGKCDSLGRLWIGTTDVERNPMSHLHCVSEGNTKQWIQGLIVSNGIAWNAKENIMYHIDTWTSTLFQYDYDIDTGVLRNAKKLYAFEGSQSKPDGMSIDVDGNLWIAFFGDASVRCYKPDTMQQLACIEMPVKYPTSCNFGGEHMDTLYITSAKVDDEHEDAGKVFEVKLSTKGRLANAYKDTIKVK